MGRRSKGADRQGGAGLAPRPLQAAPLVVVDLVARLLVPAAMLAALHGEPTWAASAAAGVSLLAVLRGALNGWSVQREIVQAWEELVDAARARDVAQLRARPADESVAMLLDAVHQIATLRALTVPRVVADAVGLVVVSAAVVLRLGALWLAVGVGLAAVLGVALAGARRRLVAYETRGWKTLAELGSDLLALVDGAAELRAHAREPWLVETMRERVAAMAADQRRATQASALVGLVPVGLALLAALVGAQGMPGGLTQGGLAEAAVLGGAGLVLGMGLVRSAEQIVRSAPQRNAIARFVDAGSMNADDGSRISSSWVGEIRFEDVGLRYAGSNAWTPSSFDLTWSDDESLVLVGPNGAGKTTLAMLLLGLLEPDRGRVTLADQDLADLDLAALRRRVAFVPQEPLIVEERSIGWHLRWTAGDDASDEALIEALGTVGLLDNLAARSNDDPLSLPAGKLSGGEKRRLSLARLVLPRPEGPPELVVVDEPEAGLDAAGRELLRGLLKQAARRCRVLLIAHDGAVVPSGFRTVTCERKPSESGAPNFAA